MCKTCVQCFGMSVDVEGSTSTHFTFEVSIHYVVSTVLFRTADPTLEKQELVDPNHIFTVVCALYFNRLSR